MAKARRSRACAQHDTSGPRSRERCCALHRALLPTDAPCSTHTRSSCCRRPSSSPSPARSEACLMSSGSASRTARCCRTRRQSWRPRCVGFVGAAPFVGAALFVGAAPAGRPADCPADCVRLPAESCALCALRPHGTPCAAARSGRLPGRAATGLSAAPATSLLPPQLHRNNCCAELLGAQLGCPAAEPTPRSYRSYRRSRCSACPSTYWPTMLPEATP